MNTDLQKILNGIVAEYGESILSEPRRVSAMFADLAREVPKPQKSAFIKSLEQGSAQVLKNAEESERTNCKQRLAQKLNNEEGLDLGLCRETLDLLERVLFGKAKGDAQKKVFCKNCGKELMNGWKVCPYCSTQVSSQVVSSRLSSGSGGRGYGISLVKPDTDACNDCKGCLLIKNEKCTFYDCPVLEADDYDCGMKGERELQKKIRTKQRTQFWLWSIFFSAIFTSIIVPWIPFLFPVAIIFGFLTGYAITFVNENYDQKKRRENAKRLSH